MYMAPVAHMCMAPVAHMCMAPVAHVYMAPVAHMYMAPYFPGLVEVLLRKGGGVKLVSITSTIIQTLDCMQGHRMT